MMTEKNKTAGKAAKIVLIFLVVISAALGGLWLGGQMMFKRAVGLLGFDGEKYQAEAGLIVAVPWVNLLLGRDITITRQGPEEKTVLHIDSVYGRGASSSSAKQWRLELAGLSWGREQAWLLAVESFELTAEYDSGAKRVSFSGGGFKGLDFEAGSVYALSGRLEDLLFERLTFGAGLAGRPLDWDIRLKGLSASEVKVQVRGKEKNYEFKPFTFTLSGLASNEDWALDFNLERLEGGAGTKAASSLGNLWAKVKEKMNLEEMLDISKFQLRAAGPWEQTTGGAERIECSLRTEFPKLYVLELMGESRPRNKDEAAAWAGDCFKRMSTKGEERLDCLGAISFDGMAIDYQDKGLIPVLDKAGRFTGRLKVGEERKFRLPDGEKYAWPLLGLGLTGWLLRNNYEAGAEGRFLFEEENKPLRPFTGVFRDDLAEGRIKPEFIPGPQ